MGQHYSDPSRENDVHALPNIETFQVKDGKYNAFPIEDDEGAILEDGWYWQACFPGCLPDGEPMGPFATEAEAVADAQSD